jgi:glutathione S-transferase
MIVMLKLYYSPNSCSLASHIVLEESGAAYELALTNSRDGSTRTPEFLALNPKARVPALLTDLGVLTENPVILGWVAQSFPDAGLAPNDDTFLFGDMQAFNMFLSATVHVAFAHHFRPERYVDGDDHRAAVKAKAAQAVAEQFRLIEAKLSDGRPWVHGERYWTSDPYLLVFSRWLGETGLGTLDDYPHAKAHRARVEARPAVQRALKAEGLS